MFNNVKILNSINTSIQSPVTKKSPNEMLNEMLSTKTDKDNDNRKEYYQTPNNKNNPSNENDLNNKKDQTNTEVKKDSPKKDFLKLLNII